MQSETWKNGNNEEGKMEEQVYKIEIKTFNLTDIFECGQCFRWNKENDGSYTGVFGHNVINVQEDNHVVTFKGICDKNIKEVCTYYFDLNRNYEDIKDKLSKIDDSMKKSISYGSGIRILNQDIWETILDRKSVV